MLLPIKGEMERVKTSNGGCFYLFNSAKINASTRKGTYRQLHQVFETGLITQAPYRKGSWPPLDELDFALSISAEGA